MMLAVVLAAATVTPTYLVERVTTTPTTVRRVSVFRDGVAVLVQRDAGAGDRLSRRRLDDVTLAAVRQVVDETFLDIETFPAFDGVPGEARVELRIAPPGRPPLILQLPLAAVPSVALARLFRALDDVDELLSAMVDGQQDLSAWQPGAGDRVLLVDGSEAVVLEVLNEGTVVHVRIGQGPAEVFYDVVELRRRSVRRMPP